MTPAALGAALVDRSTTGSYEIDAMDDSSDSRAVNADRKSEHLLTVSR